MPQFQLRVGELKVDPSLPAVDLRLGGDTIRQYFARATAGAAGSTPLIGISVDADRITLPPRDGAGVDVGQLHGALQRLTNNSTTSSAGVRTIGLILTDTYLSRPNAYGMMFDQGFSIPTDPTDIEADRRVPREGAAVFLNKIRSVRPDDDDFANQVTYTAIHEIGHLFNLWHIAGPESFMTQRTDDRIFQTRAFVPEHLAYLNHIDEAEHARFILPGGTNFGTRSAIDGVPQGGEAREAVERACRDRGAPPRQSKLPFVLKIGLSHEHFFPFEPVELDVRVELAAGRKRAVDLPDEVDPGYERFDVWITRPDGERHRYRSPTLYCESLQPIAIGPEKPLVRDITLFGQAGGYTFTMPGTHKLRATMRLPGGVLVSNEVECEVRGARRDDADYRAKRAALATGGAAEQLFYRFARPRKRVHDQLCDFVRNCARSAPASAAIAEYSLGRSFAKSVMATTATAAVRIRAIDYLRRARDRKSLGDHRRVLATRVIDELRAT